MGSTGRHSRGYPGSAALLMEDKRIELTTEEPVRFLSERIQECNGNVIVERGPEGFLFAGNKLPKLSDTESAISLLKHEDRIAPIHRALERVLFSAAESTQIVVLDPSYRERLDTAPFATVDALRENTELAVFIKAYVALRSHPDAFERIRQKYIDIFGSVTDLTVDRMVALDPVEAKRALLFSHDVITVAIKERGSDDWIVGPYISSGMRRTFFHLTELEFAPRGTTIVIDEYENSMGVNCLPAVTDLFLQRQDELQFILTSHHPYVIDNVPLDWWRVVTRKGGVVTVRPAREIPELDTRSQQDRFTLLANSSVFEQGIQ